MATTVGICPFAASVSPVGTVTPQLAGRPATASVTGPVIPPVEVSSTCTATSVPSVVGAAVSAEIVKLGLEPVLSPPQAMNAAAPSNADRRMMVVFMTQKWPTAADVVRAAAVYRRTATAPGLPDRA